MTEIEDGQFTWYELLTSDPAAAAKFYGEVVGWDARDSGMPGMDYTIFNSGERGVAGLMRQPDEMGDAPPAWVGYVQVADTDATARDFETNGGKVHQPANDIPGVGRFAMLEDSTGGVIGVLQPTERAEAGPHQMTPKEVGWNELHATDGKAAADFYAARFGWTTVSEVEMGPGLTYRQFATPGLPDDSTAAGGMMTRHGDYPPHWAYYFAVPDIDDAVRRVEAAGGKVLNGPMEVPGGAWVINGQDPQGAMFSLVAPPKGDGA